MPILTFQNFPRLIGDCDVGFGGLLVGTALSFYVPVSKLSSANRGLRPIAFTFSKTTLILLSFQNFPRLIGDCDATSCWRP